MQPADDDLHEHSPRTAWLRAALLVLWAAASFGVAFFARELDQAVGGWSLNFWLLAQGGVLVFIGIVTVYAWVVNRAGAHTSSGEGDGKR
jgi:putative solute:sodium symporter small subunit